MHDDLPKRLREQANGNALMLEAADQIERYMAVIENLHLLRNA